MFINFCIYLFLYLFDSKRLDAFPMDIYKNNKGNSYNYRVSNKEPDLNSLLQENLVESSLKDTINITDQAKKNNNNNHIPQYMLNLYNVASNIFSTMVILFGAISAKVCLRITFFISFTLILIKTLCSSLFNMVQLIVTHCIAVR